MTLVLCITFQKITNHTKPMQPAIYILASQLRGTLYVGVTSDLIKRVWQHKNNLVDGFTKQYAVHTLVYFELHASMVNAISREKQLKAGSRAKKMALIEGMNPLWDDLYPGLL
ncbi:GIY-YIG nuclease family protein [Rhodoferax sp.]|uniref:GIY-YIG nuclease family protein n=1 Tax=Rhodoferax sp. TaxID=50421 RepID=UPI00261C20E2|nr:GIY-YIG nuclease family protein [Rhodoferax sp.]MDD2918867.1 GIY-YIG nuclease family protein [Rhodoferax sp.]